MQAKPKHSFLLFSNAFSSVLSVIIAGFDRARVPGAQAKPKHSFSSFSNAFSSVLSVIIAGLDWVRAPGAQAKPKHSFSSFSNAFSSVLSVTSSGRSPPELVPEAHLASCSGNWLSHLDWDGRRCGPLRGQNLCARGCLL